jgi:hypothetical protein
MNRRHKITKLSDPTSMLDHINRAYSELSKVQHIVKSFALNEKEYQRLLEVYKLMGRIRMESLGGS